MPSSSFLEQQCMALKFKGYSELAQKLLIERSGWQFFLINCGLIRIIVKISAAASHPLDFLLRSEIDSLQFTFHENVLIKIN